MNLFASVLDQRKFHHPMESPQAMDVEGQEVVLHEAPIFRLVLGDDTEIGIMQPSGQMVGLPRRMYREHFVLMTSTGTFSPGAPLMQR